jgi:predicted Zn-dependent protease
MTRLLLIFCFAALFSCQEIDRYLPQIGKKGPADTAKRTYSFACLDSAVGGNGIGRTLGKAGDVIRDLAVSEKKITDELQSEYGAAFHQQMVVDEKAFKLLNNPQLQRRLDEALQQLLQVRPNPSRIKYAIYPLDDTAVNAFTFGGRIYVTKAMLQKTGGSKALLYAIVGHEIGHSEEGHIKKSIQELQLTTNIFGEANAGTVLQISKLLTASFNQRNELEADYYGVELTHRLGQELCATVAFWKEMASRENRYSQVEDFFRTHPFSALRAQCLQAHIMANFGTRCDGVDAEETHPQLMTAPPEKGAE